MPYWSQTFPGQAACLSEVRRFTTVALGDLPGVDAVELVVSELTGNAIQHTASGWPGGHFTLHLAALKDYWLVRVDDDGGVNEPQLRCAYVGEDETGRGLALVSELRRPHGRRGRGR